jgi:hypothetical protein
MRSRLLIAFAEMAGAAFITYQQLPPHEKQHVRMVVYRELSRILYHASGKMGQLAMQAELKYAKEIGTNG